MKARQCVREEQGDAFTLCTHICARASTCAIGWAVEGNVKATHSQVRHTTHIRDERANDGLTSAKAERAIRIGRASGVCDVRASAQAESGRA